MSLFTGHSLPEVARLIAEAVDIELTSKMFTDFPVMFEKHLYE